MILWCVHLAATWFMVGLIWVIQLVHYPLFAQVGRGEFSAYHADHNKLITMIVMPVMLTELISAFALALYPPARFQASLLWISVVLVGIAWLTTAFASVPAHGVLSAGFDLQAHRSLVLTNWARTIAWSIKGALLLVMTYQALTKGQALAP